MILAIREAAFLMLGNALPRGIGDRFRPFAYRLAGMAIDSSATIWGPMTVRPVGGCKKVHIGAGSFLNTETRFGAGADIVIGRNVAIGPRVSFETTSHGLVHRPATGRDSRRATIIVEDEAWIGAGSILLPGVRVGRGAVVAAGAVVNKDVEAFSLVAGVPARMVRRIEVDAEL